MLAAAAAATAAAAGIGTNSGVALAAALHDLQSVAIARAFVLCCCVGVTAGDTSTNSANRMASAKDALSEIQ